MRSCRKTSLRAMLKMKAKVLSVAAKKLNVSTGSILELLSSKGIRVDNNPNAKLTADQLDVLAANFKDSDLFGESVNTTSPTVTQAIDNSKDILYFREEPEPEKIKIDRTLDGPKIIGKIDLNSKSTPKIIAVDEPIIVESPKIIEAEKIPEVKVEIVEVPAPIVEETPVVIAEVEQKPEVIEVTIPEEPMVVETKIEATVPVIVENVEEEENVLIKAQGDKLQGLTVLGKINLPVERKPLTKEEAEQAYAVIG